MPVGTIGHFGKLLSSLPSADIEQMTTKAGTGGLAMMDKFLAGTVKIVRESGADLQKRRNC